MPLAPITGAKTLALGAVLAVAVASGAAAQRAESAGIVREMQHGLQAKDTERGGEAPLILTPRMRTRADSAWWLPLLSTAMPGTGQYMLRQDRAIAYLAGEGMLLVQLLRASDAERKERDRSRVLARDVARAIFGGTRPVGTWPYYENMEHFVESGVFDLVPGGEVEPESDVQTYNGWLWLDVRQRYWDNPNVSPQRTSAAYVNALNEYNRRAVREEGRWSWRNAQLEQDVFRRTIKRKNQAARSATNALGLLALNHLLSTIDAFVTLRVRGLAGATEASRGLELSVPWAPFGRPDK